MKSSLSENKELDSNYLENDAFGFAVKADAIRSFLEYNVKTLLGNKMIALYGNWGSGKTSLMRFIADQIDKTIYMPIFFEAWQFEKDENLAISLCDLLTSQLHSKDRAGIKDFKTNAYRVLKGFASGINVKVGSEFLGGELEFSGKDFIEGIEKNNQEQKSALSFNQEFKKSFRELEQSLLQEFGAQRIIVFVDDLDRCEPEHVLNLITALKLFFTYGDSTIFFCGLDKDAVTKAVISKYQDIIKSEEYLEKVFDINFHMPKSFSLEKMLKLHFGGVISINGIEKEYSGFIDEFFNSIQFTNPRHIKKILNKYQIVRSFKENDSLPEHVRILIPEILDEKGKGNLFETVFCLFFIMLYEFYPDQFRDIEDYERKFKQYIRPMSDGLDNGGKIVSDQLAGLNLERFYIKNIEQCKFSNIIQPVNSEKGLIKLLFIFADKSPIKLNHFTEVSLDDFGNYFLDNGKLTLFCKFMIKHRADILSDNLSNYIFWNYFRMCNYLL